MALHSRRAAIALAAAGVAGLVAVPVAARAEDYPTWKEVLAARNDVKQQRQEVAKIKALLAQSQAAADRAEQVAQQKGTVYQAARDRVDAAASRLEGVQKQVRAAQAEADEASSRAAQLAAQLTRTGGTDPETSLLLSGTDGSAADFLQKLGRLSKLTESNGAIAAAAASARDTAAATQAQLKEAKAELVDLQQQAKSAFDAAVRASDAANTQLQREQAKQVELQALLDALQADSEQVARRYQAGVAAKRRAQLAGAAGAVNSGGWALPASGVITGTFGPRPDQPAGANYFHRGTDIGCAYGSPIYAAAAGTVIYAGWYGTYGNFIEISHAGGIQTGYAHIRPGGIFVKVGQTVTAGQNIASVGTTGASTGPHLHFETRIGEVAVDAQPFMAQRSITLG